MKKRIKARLLAYVLAFTTMVFSMPINVAKAEEPDRTVPYFGTDYSLNYILSHYGYFTPGDLTGDGHTVGSFVVGGKLNINQGIADGSLGPNYAYQYVGGNLEATRYHNLDNSGFIPVLELYTNQFVNAAVNWGNGDQISKYDNIPLSDFIDMDAAMSSIRSESNGWMNPNGATSNVTVTDTANGKEVSIDLSSECIATVEGMPNDYSKISLTGITLEDLTLRGYVITFNGSGAFEFNFVGRVYIEGDKELGKQANELAKFGSTNSIEVNSAGLNLLWNFPNATKGTVNEHLGHIIAPNCDLTKTSGGNSNGSMIAKSIETYNQNHFWPINPNVTFPGPVNGNDTPGNDTPGGNTPGNDTPDDNTPGNITPEKTVDDISISKVDVFGNELSGAVLALYLGNPDSEDPAVAAAAEKIDEWTSIAGNHVIPGSKLKFNATYVLKEISTPADGDYILTSNIVFTIDGDGKVSSVSANPSVEYNSTERLFVVTDGIERKDLSISKSDVYGNELANASITLYKGSVEAGSVVDSWVSTTVPHKIYGSRLELGATYTIHEVSAPDGYIVASDIVFTIKLNGRIDFVSATADEISRSSLSGDSRVIVMIDDADSSNGGTTPEPGNTPDDGTTPEPGNTPDGGTTPEPGNTPDGGTTPEPGNTPDGGTTPEPGNTPNGGTTPEPGNTPDGGTTPEPGNTPDDDIIIPSDVSISKINVSGNEIAGAKMYLYEVSIEADGSVSENCIKEWISAGAPQKIDGSKLSCGTTYILREEYAPKGYAIATDIEFTIGADGKIDEDSIKATAAELEASDAADGHIVMIDDAISNVAISKRNVGGEEIPGASLKLYQGNPDDGVIVDEWISEKDKTHTISGADLKTNTTYVLVEIAAPENTGYKVASSISFTINSKGNISNISQNAGAASSADERLIVMVDDAIITDVFISKTDVAGEELAGAELTLYKGNPEDGVVIESWLSGENNESAHKINGSKLKLGETYTLREEAAPLGYLIASDITFTIGYDGAISDISETAASASDKDAGLIVMVDDVDNSNPGNVPNNPPKGITFYKADDNGALIADAQLTLYKGDIEDGIIVDSWVSSSVEPYVIPDEKLEIGEGYTVREEVVPFGYVIADDITFTIGSDGKIHDISNAGEGTDVESYIIVMVDVTLTGDPGAPLGSPDNGGTTPEPGTPDNGGTTPEPETPDGTNPTPSSPELPQASEPTESAPAPSNAGNTGAVTPIVAGVTYVAETTPDGRNVALKDGQVRTGDDFNGWAIGLPMAGFGLAMAAAIYFRRRISKSER